MRNIKIADYVSLNQGVTSEEGLPIFEQIIETLKSGEKVELDFSDMTFLTTAFLNVVIGTLYKDYTSDNLKEILILKGVSPDTAVRIKKVTDNAKAFYADQEKFDKSVQEAIYGDM